MMSLLNTLVKKCQTDVKKGGRFVALATFFINTLFEDIERSINTNIGPQGRLNSLKVVGAQLTNKTHFYCEKLNFYEHL